MRRRDDSLWLRIKNRVKDIPDIEWVERTRMSSRSKNQVELSHFENENENQFILLASANEKWLHLQIKWSTKYGFGFSDSNGWLKLRVVKFLEMPSFHPIFRDFCNFVHFHQSPNHRLCQVPIKTEDFLSIIHFPLCFLRFLRFVFLLLTIPWRLRIACPQGSTWHSV